MYSCVQASVALLNCVTHVASLCSLVISNNFYFHIQYIITYFLYIKLAHLYIEIKKN